MEPILTFIGSYWWLGFFAVPAIAGAADHMRTRSKRKHKQKLELIRAQSEAKAREIEARSRAGLPAPTTADTHPALTPPASDTREIDRLTAAHDDLIRRWLDYELDVAKVIAFPSMSDGRQPLTGEFLLKKRIADNLRPVGPASAERIAEYRTALTAAEVAFEIAERDARRVRTQNFTPDERKRLDTAQQLLALAVDESATPAERQSAYRRVRAELDGLISLSDAAVENLEKKVARAIAPRDPLQPPPMA